jgi:hypothetical protein
MLAWPLIASGPAAFLDSTFGYQLWQRGGGVQFSIWTYLSGAEVVARPVLAAGLVLLALSPLWRRDPAAGPRQHAALAAALLFGGQLLLGYWFYSYLTWCYPLLVVAVVHAPAQRQALGEDLDRVADADHGAGPQSAGDRLVGDQVDAEPHLPVPAAVPR